ncbi:hypothetical protein BHC44_04320 [Snodgrassella alvi]|nr:hypothetical protein BHC44_04320 [Snodgrassella alvi]
MMNQEKCARRIFSADFKSQIVKLYQQGKSRSELVKAVHLRLKITLPQKNKLIVLRKELKPLRMKNDILKQTALII